MQIIGLCVTITLSKYAFLWGNMSEILRLLSESKSSCIVKRIYSCPCGNGTIQEEQDYTPGHRDGFASLLCNKCKNDYYIDFGNSSTKWSIKKRKELKSMDNIWLLTEERPKTSVVFQIIEMYCTDFNDKITLNQEIKIKPMTENGKFVFTYIVEGLKVEQAQNIFIKTISGYSSSVDFLLFKQKNMPKENDLTEIPLMAIEETKTSDDESRNTGVSQRVSKFVYLRSFYSDVKMYMLYNEELEARPNKKPSNTSIFGTNILLSLGVTIVGKDTSKWFAPFESLDELIKFKSDMRKPPKGNVPVRITKYADRIEVSGRLSKPANKGNIGHDPNIGTISMIGAGVRSFDQKVNIVVTRHGVSQEYVEKNQKNKFLYNCSILNMSLDGLKTPSSIKLPDYYWHYERKSEKVASILLHLTCLYSGIKGIYENHAGCERSYFKTNTGLPIALPKKDKSGKKLRLPDVVLFDDDVHEIYNVEGKKLTTLKQGLKEIETYDAIENEYIKVKYPGCKIERWVSIFGGNKRKVPNEKVLIYLNDDGEVYINEAAPKNIKVAFEKIKITC